MRNFLISSSFVLFIPFVCGIRTCLKCINERSFQSCHEAGRRERCLSNQETCFVEVRRNQQGFQITAGCKQRLACRNIALENGNCRNPRMNSVCRWCCDENLCNDLHTTTTTIAPTLTTRRDEPEPVKVCPLLEELEHGSITCDLTPENQINSVCHFSCIEGYELYPSDLTTSTCQPNQHWSTETPLCRRKRCSDEHNIEHGSVYCTDDNFVASQCFFTCDEQDGYHLFPSNHESSTCLSSKTWSLETPCCLRECPRYAEVDLVILLDSSSSVGRDNWRIMKQFAFNITEQFTISDNLARIAVARYNSKVDNSSEIKLNDFQEFDKKFRLIPYNGSGTRTGEALTYVRQVLLSEENGNRPGVPDVVLTITDGTSRDDVATISAALRDDGVTTFALGIRSLHGKLNEEQLLEIAGAEERFIKAERGFTELGEALMNVLTQKLCRFQCGGQRAR